MKHLLPSGFPTGLLCLFAGIILLCGCKDPDTTQELRERFENLKEVCAKFDAILEGIDDPESARAAVDDLKEYRKQMREEGWHIGFMIQDIKKRSAAGLKLEINQYRTKRRDACREELRRLDRIPGVSDILIPVLRKMDEDIAMPAGPPEG